MLRGRRFPDWLVRRGYFKRIERWTKLDKAKALRAAFDPEPVAMTCNVLPFPDRSGAARRAGRPSLSGVGSA